MSLLSAQSVPIKPALLITKGLNGTGIVEEIEGILKYAKISVTGFSGVPLTQRVPCNPKGTL